MRSEGVRCPVEHEKINFMFPCNRVTCWFLGAAMHQEVIELRLTAGDFIFGGESYRTYN